MKKTKPIQSLSLSAFRHQRLNKQTNSFHLIKYSCTYIPNKLHKNQ